MEEIARKMVQWLVPLPEPPVHLLIFVAMPMIIMIIHKDSSDALMKKYILGVPKCIYLAMFWARN